MGVSQLLRPFIFNTKKATRSFMYGFREFDSTKCIKNVFVDDKRPILKPYISAHLIDIFRNGLRNIDLGERDLRLLGSTMLQLIHNLPWNARKQSDFQKKMTENFKSWATRFLSDQAFNAVPFSSLYVPVTRGYFRHGVVHLHNHPILKNRWGIVSFRNAAWREWRTRWDYRYVYVYFYPYGEYPYTIPSVVEELSPLRFPYYYQRVLRNSETYRHSHLGTNFKDVKMRTITDHFSYFSGVEPTRFTLLRAIRNITAHGDEYPSFCPTFQDKIEHYGILTALDVWEVGVSRGNTGFLGDPPHFDRSYRD